jgi:hypothetical protein
MKEQQTNETVSAGRCCLDRMVRRSLKSTLCPWKARAGVLLWPIERWARLRLLEAKMLRLQLLMCLSKTRIICLTRGYLTGNEPNLGSNGVLWSAGIHHPVEIIKVLLEAWHIVQRDVDISSNDKLSDRRENNP